MKQLELGFLLSANQLFGLTERWLMLNIAANKPPEYDEDDPFVYAQQVSCKVGQIHFLPENNLANLYFVFPPIIRLNKVAFVAKRLVVGEDWSFVYGHTLENGEEEADFEVFCTAIFLLDEEGGDHT